MNFNFTARVAEERTFRQDIELLDIRMYSIQNYYTIIESRVFCNYKVVAMENMAPSINI